MFQQPVAVATYYANQIHPRFGSYYGQRNYSNLNAGLFTAPYGSVNGNNYYAGTGLPGLDGNVIPENSYGQENGQNITQMMMPILMLVANLFGQLARNNNQTPQLPQITNNQLRRINELRKDNDKLHFHRDKRDPSVLTTKQTIGDMKFKTKVYPDGTSAEIEEKPEDPNNPGSKKGYYRALITRLYGIKELIVDNDKRNFYAKVNSIANPEGAQIKRMREIQKENPGLEFQWDKNHSILSAYQNNQSEGLEKTTEVHPEGILVEKIKDSSGEQTKYKAIIKIPGSEAIVIESDNQKKLEDDIIAKAVIKRSEESVVLNPISYQ